MNATHKKSSRGAALWAAALLTGLSLQCSPHEEPREDDGDEGDEGTVKSAIASSVRIEAESMTLTGYQTRSASFASGGSYVQLPASSASNAQGTARSRLRRGQRR